MAGANPALGNFTTSNAPSGVTYTFGESGGFVTLTIGGSYNPVSAANGSWLPPAARILQLEQRV